MLKDAVVKERKEKKNMETNILNLKSKCRDYEN